MNWILLTNIVLIAVKYTFYDNIGFRYYGFDFGMMVDIIKGISALGTILLDFYVIYTQGINLFYL